MEVAGVEMHLWALVRLVGRCDEDDGGTGMHCTLGFGTTTEDLWRFCTGRLGVCGIWEGGHCVMSIPRTDHGGSRWDSLGKYVKASGDYTVVEWRRCCDLVPEASFSPRSPSHVTTPRLPPPCFLLSRRSILSQLTEICCPSETQMIFAEPVCSGHVRNVSC